MAQNAIELVQGTVFDHQFALATLTVIDGDPGPETLGQIVLQGPYIGINGTLVFRLALGRLLLDPPHQRFGLALSLIHI